MTLDEYDQLAEAIQRLGGAVGSSGRTLLSIVTSATVYVNKLREEINLHDGGIHLPPTQHGYVVEITKISDQSVTHIRPATVDTEEELRAALRGDPR